MAKQTRIIRTARRSIPRPEPGAVFAADEISILANIPPVVVIQALASGELKAFRLNGVELVDGADLSTWIELLDARIVAAKAA